jgi:peptide/nickel transport system ATP-binding protein
MVGVEPGIVGGELRVVVDGAETLPLADRDPSARERAFRRLRGGVLGYMAQDARAALDPLARVGVQVGAVATLGGRSADPLPWLIKANLREPERVAKLYPHELSGGMAQRVALAQVLARGSRYLIADEPTSALDPTIQKAVLAELRSLADAGLGVLLVTHDLRVLPGLADEVVILHEGRVVEHTTPEAVVDGAVHSPAARRLVDATRLVAAGVLG